MKKDDSAFRVMLTSLALEIKNHLLKTPVLFFEIEVHPSFCCEVEAQASSVYH